MNPSISKLTSPPAPITADGGSGSGLGTNAEATSGVGITNVVPRTVSEKAKQIEREMLMERIRSKAGQQRSFHELSRAMRMAMLEKRYALDAVEKSSLQKSLERLQKHIKVKTRAGLVERLENLSKQLGMKFMEDAAGLFISTDMFYLEIILDTSGKLTDVKVHHECKIEQTSCKELVNCLNNGDFADFTAQLEGLSAIYQLNAEPKVKTKAFVALQAMETDLLKLYQWQSTANKETLQRVAESCVGIALPRRGGHAVRLTYFVSPYDFINLETQKFEDPGIDGINAKQLGLSVTVNLEASSANKLQILPIVSFSKDVVTGIENGQPIYAPLTQANSMLLPATFVFRLNKPLPVCCNALQKILPQNVQPTSQPSSSLDAAANTNLINLIVQTALDQQTKGAPQKGLFVNLPDSTHCYFFTDNKKMKGTLLTSVPFTEPSQVPKIIGFLKKQALFYTLITSCVRPQSRMGHDMDSTIILEINAISFEKIAISLQHPYEESLATVEFDLSSGRGLIQCSIYSLYADYTEAARKMSLVIQKSLSIPVTIRSMLRYWDKERLEMFQKGISPATSGGGGGGLLAQASYGLSLSSHMPMGGDILSDAAASGAASTTKPNTKSGGSSNASAAASGIAGYLKYKQEPFGAASVPAIKSEDVTDHGKVSTSLFGANVLPAATIAGMTTPTSSSEQSPSLISQASISQMMQKSLSGLNKASDMEIADKYKNIWKDKTPNLKSGQSNISSLGATDTTNQPHTGAISPHTINLDVKRTGGIEIIPLTSSNQQMSIQSQAMPTLATMVTSTATAPHSTITITPINTAVSSSVSSSPATTAIGLNPSNVNVSAVAGSMPVGVKRPAGSDADATLSSSSNSSTSSNSSLTSSSAPPKEKKRKKKRDDSPMGPPEKVYSRQNSPSSSPVGAGGSSISNAALSTRPSPKHSPVYSSPKHTNTASNSPKSPFGTHSPKHGSAGKPSMSTLKSASSAVAAVTSAAAVVNMKCRDKDKSTPISTATALGVGSGGLSTTASGGISGLMAATITSKSPHLGMTGINSSMGMTGTQSVGGLSQQLKSVASLNQYLSGFGSGGGSSTSSMPSSLTSSSDITASIAAVSAAALALRKNQGIPPPPPPPVSLTNAGSSGIVASGAGAAVSSMMSPPIQQRHHQQYHQQQQQQQYRQQQQQQMPSQPPLSHGNERHQLAKNFQNPEQAIRGGSVTLEEFDAVAIGSVTRSSSRCSLETLSTSSSSGTGTEYMVKSSEEGIKLTINKTTSSGGNSKSTFTSTTISSSTSKTSLSSPSTISTTIKTPPIKRHTGLKPGVLSGPASKKGRTSPNSTSSPSSSSSANSSPQSASPQSTTSSSSQLSKTSPSLMSSFSRTATQSNENVIRLMHYAAAATTTTSTSSKPTPTLSAAAATTTTNTSQNIPSMEVEALLGTKSLTTKFQFPKLTQRTGSNISTSASPATSTAKSSSIDSRNQRSSPTEATTIATQQKLQHPPKTNAPATSTNEPSKKFTTSSSDHLNQQFQ